MTSVIDVKWAHTPECSAWECVHSVELSQVH